MEDKSINAGKVGLTMGGDWKSSESYEKLTCVSHNGRSWAAKKNVSAGVEPSAANSEFWQMMSDRGEQGIQGPVGPQGNSAYVKDGVVNKFELVNNLTQGGEAAALSAEQGKILKAELTELESDVYANCLKNPQIGFFYDNKGVVTFSENGDYRCEIIDLALYTKIKIKTFVQGVAATFITDIEDNILYTISGEELLFEGSINLADYPKAAKLYFTNAVSRLPMKQAFCLGKANYKYLEDENKKDISTIRNILLKSTPSLLTIKKGFVASTDGNFVPREEDLYKTAFFPVSGKEVYIDVYSQQSNVAAKYLSFYGSDGLVSIGGRLDYIVGENIFEIPYGATQVGIVAVFNGEGLVDNIVVSTTDGLPQRVANLEDQIKGHIAPAEVLKGFVDSENGNFVAREEDFFLTAFYPIRGATAIITILNNQNELDAKYLSFYGADGNVSIGGKLNYVVGENIFEIPKGATQIGIIATFYGKGSVDNIKVRSSNIGDWSNYKWLLVGDSLTEVNIRAKTHYHDYIAADTGIFTINKGKSGQGYASGDYFRYAIMQSTNIDFDFATFFGSGNDIRPEIIPSLQHHEDFASAMGDIDDNGTDTICGYINRCFDKFIELFPLKKFGVITPTPWKNGSYDIAQFSDEETHARLELYSDKLVAICRKRGIPCLDLFHCSGLRPNNEQFRIAYYNEAGVQDSGVHPNSAGHRWIKNMFATFLQTYLIDVFKV